MPRSPRIEYPGAVYHLLCRGDRKEPIFLDEWDRERFLETLGEVCERSGWCIHAYALMGNHYHLLAETPEANLVEGMRWFQGTYTQRFNRRHRMVGHLFQGRYKALLVDGTASDYFRTVADYIHLNPTRAGLLDANQPDVRGYPWSSAAYFGRGPNDYSDWLQPKAVFHSMGIADLDAKGRQRFVTLLNALSRAYLKSPDDPAWEEQWKNIRRGWYLGETPFREELLLRMEEGVRGRQPGSYAGPSVRQHDARQADRLLDAGLKHLELNIEALDTLKKSDDRKKALATWIRRQTMVSNTWLAEQLRMGKPASVSRYLGDVQRAPTRGTNSFLRKLKNAKVED